MEKVNISALKSHLSEVLQAVRRGKEFLVMDRKDPVARLCQVPEAELDSGDSRATLQGLYEEGILDLPLQPKPKASRLKNKLIGAKGSAVKALLAEREETLF